MAVELVTGADAAISKNNAAALNNLPDGGAVDTYCGVDGFGNPLPSYFGAGKSSKFCAAFVPVYDAVGNASSKAGILTVLTAHRAQIDALATETSTLPVSIKAKATAAMSNAQQVIATKNLKLLVGGGNGPASYVGLYCGQNE